MLVIVIIFKILWDDTMFMKTTLCIPGTKPCMPQQFMEWENVIFPLTDWSNSENVNINVL